MRKAPYGITIVELLVVLAIIGILTSIGIVSLPRQQMTVDQAQRIFASAVQFARFEAIKRNRSIEVVFAAASDEILIRNTVGGATLRTFALDPQGQRAVVKSVSPNAVFVFNARGVASTPIERLVTIGIRGTVDFDRSLSVSGQGSVRRAS